MSEVYALKKKTYKKAFEATADIKVVETLKDKKRLKRAQTGAEWAEPIFRVLPISALHRRF